MRHLTFVYAYYDNPGMLAAQYACWAAYPEWSRRRVRVIVVDDASPRWPALEVPRPRELPKLSIYRVKVDIPWHQDGARNLGAHEAAPGWLFLSDIDHMLPASSLAQVLRFRSPLTFYTFGRIDAPHGRRTVDAHGRPKIHPNSYAMTRDLYWAAGGYDEDFCGFYGTDGPFRRQLLKVGRHVHKDDIPIIRYSREVISDASTTTLVRKSADREAQKLRILEDKWARGRQDYIATLDFEWDRVL